MRVANDKPKIYVDASPIIDLVKVRVDVNVPSDRSSDTWHLQKMLDAALDGKVRLFTSVLSLAECVHVEDQNKLEQAKPFFMGLLASGRGGLTLIQPILAIAERARDLRWIHGIALKGADAIHVASALHFRCDECWSRDGGFASSAATLDKLGLRVCSPSETRLLPDEYRQEQLGLS